MTDHKLDEDDASQDSEECLLEMLGGISFQGVSADAWNSRADQDDEPDIRPTLPSSHPSRSPQQTNQLYNLEASITPNTERVFENAFRSLPPTSHDTKLPVQVVTIPTCGNGLVSTTDIPRGSVIYTERALLAAQHDVARVRACQNCFRSLEPISKLHSDLPLPHLWPVPEFQFVRPSPDDDIRTDNLGRVVCTTCESNFCSDACRRQSLSRFGSCCNYVSVAGALDDPVLALSVKSFVYSLQLYRNNQSLDESMLQGLCGEANNVNELELGDFDVETSTYSLHTLYNSLADAYTMSLTEKSVLSLEYIQKLAAIAARNGVGILTQSPFKPYYEAVLRSTGGRGSAKHDEIKARVAMALDSPDGKLQRGMDRQVDGQVAAQMSALFVLRARINHSCAPNASIQSQVFCDAHMDLVALQDIQRGEEITISYIGTGHGVGKKSTSRRRRELQSKYLFFCECAECRK